MIQNQPLIWSKTTKHKKAVIQDLLFTYGDIVETTKQFCDGFFKSYTHPAKLDNYVSYSIE